MSVEIRAKIICDGCGSWIEGEAATTTTNAMLSYSLAKGKAIHSGWVYVPKRYGKPKHLCRKCADGTKPDVPTGTLATEADRRLSCVNWFCEGWK